MYQVPYINIQNNKFVRYNVTENMRKRNEIKERNLSENKYKGRLSRKAKTRMINATKWLCELAPEKYINVDGKQIKYRLPFITLTLPSKQMHSDVFIKSKCLNQFFVELRNINKSEFNYLWKAELQKNGKIHFHILTDSGLHYKELNKIWCRIIEKYGYVSEYQKNNDTDKLPNACDIHQTKGIKDIVAYVAKYISKDDKDIKPDLNHIDSSILINGKRVLEGRLWFCSKNLQNLDKNIECVDYELEQQYVAYLESKKVEKPIKCKKSGKDIYQYYEGDFFSSVNYSFNKLYELPFRLVELVRWSRELVRLKLYSPSLLFKNKMKEVLTVVKKEIVNPFLSTQLQLCYECI